MEEQIKQLNEKVDRLQATLDWMVEHLQHVQKSRSLGAVLDSIQANGNHYIGLGPSNNISYPGADQ